MSDQTPFLNFPFLLPNQAQKHVSYNEALRDIDVLLQCAVADADITELPAPSQSHVRFLVAAEPGEALQNYQNSLAVFGDGVWNYVQPKIGWRVWVESEGVVRVFNGQAWQPLSSSNGGGSFADYEGALSNLEAVGIGTAAQEGVGLIVQGGNSLFDGVPSHRMAINKQTADGTASLLFQTGFSGRAEIGLTGDDRLSMRVSTDGQTWKEGPQVQPDGTMSCSGFHSHKLNIERDAAIEFTPNVDHGILMCILSWGNFPQATHSGIMAFDIATSPLLVSLGLGPSTTNQGTRLLSGTTGPDGKLNISAASGKLYFENRIDTQVTVTTMIMG